MIAVTMPSDLERTIASRRRIYLLRHGEVSYFDERGEPYRQNDVPLNDAGRQQARAAADALADVSIDRLVTTGLPRTVETASYLTGDRDLSPRTELELREITPGRMDEHDPSQLETIFTRALRGSVDAEARFLGGETFGSLVGRVIPAFVGLVQEADWREMAIVAHGGTNRAVLSHCLGASWSTFEALEQDAGCINIIDVDADGSFIVRLVNFTPSTPSKAELRATTMERIWLEHLAPRVDSSCESSGEA